MNKILLLSAALLFSSSLVKAQSGRETIDLSGEGWHLLVDKQAPWRNDHLYPPSEIKDLSLLPVNAPTGGWGVLNAANMAVRVPGSVAEYTNHNPQPRPEHFLGVSWWYRTIDVPANLNDKRVVLNFESVRFRAEVYLDGKLVAYDVVGDSPFSADITDAVKNGGKHTLAVRVTNPGGQYHWQDYAGFKWGKYEMPAGRGFGGITGLVDMNITDKVYIDDIYMQNTAASDSVNAIVTIYNEVKDKKNQVKPGKYDLTFIVKEKNTGKVVVSRQAKKVLVGDSTVYQMPLKLIGARLWSVESPSLYTCEVQVSKGKTLVDNDQRTFGFRSFVLDGIGSNAMPRLNGKRMQLRTAISWGFFPVTGISPEPEMAEKQIKTAKAMGLNMLNFHRCIGKPTILNAADSLGLLYFEEPGAWQLGYKSPFTREILNEKLRRMIKRDRSHPSLVIYCLINEMGGVTTRNKAIMDQRKADLAVAHTYDPSRTMVLTSGWASTEDAEEDSKAHFRPFDDKMYMKGWWDNHRAAGPMTWQEDFYESPTKGLMYSTNNTEIYMRGEEGALTSPPRLQLIHDELVKTGRKGWDGDTWEMQYQKALAFFNEKGLAKNFGSLDNWTRSLGDISFEHQGRRIQGMRMWNQGDIYAINGWEEHMYDNNSGVVDLHRNPKGNLSTLTRYTQPLYVAVAPRKQIVKPNDRVAVDFYIVNEKDLKGDYTLKMSMKTPAGQVIWSQQSACQVKGGDVFGQLLSENMQVPTATADGMYRIEATLLDGNSKEIARGYDDVLVVDDSEALKGRGAIYAYKDDKIAAYYQKKTGKALPAFTKKTGKLDWLIINRSLLDSPALIDKKYFRNVKVTWFSDDDYRAKAGEEKDEWINRSFADGAQPASCLPANNAFSVRWEGELVPDETGQYLLALQSNRGVRLWVDNVQLIDNIGNKKETLEKTPVVLEAGKPVKIRIEYRQQPNSGYIQFQWARPSATSISCEDILKRVEKDGTKLIILGEANTWMKDVAEKTGLKYDGCYNVGKNWVGGTQFVTEHPVLNGLPTNMGMNWPYQAVVRDGDHRFSFRMHGEKLIAGAYKNTPFDLGTTLGEIPYGKGKILFSGLDIIDNLENPAGPAMVARKLFANFINY